MSDFWVVNEYPDVGVINNNKKSFLFKRLGVLVVSSGNWSLRGCCSGGDLVLIYVRHEEWCVIHILENKKETSKCDNVKYFYMFDWRNKH